MRLLRDKAGLTRLLLLLELHRGNHVKLRGLAERLGITVQGVSNYVAQLQGAGLVRVAQGRYEPTPRGMQALQEQLTELKGFVDLAYQRVSVIERCSAVARTRVREGEPVGLFLEEGLLVARARRASPSRGVAAHDARAGELVRVRALQGLVALRPGKVVVLKVPLAAGPETGRAARALRRWLGREGWEPDKLGCAGTEAQALAAAARLAPDFAFAPAHASHHAAQLGLDVLLLAGPDQVRFVTAELDRLDEEALEPVRHELRELRVGR